MSLPGKLPALDATIAPPTPSAAPPVPLAAAVPTGQVSPSDARNAGEAIWPALAPCLQDWQGDLVLQIGLAGGEPPGSSRVYEPRISTATVSATLRACVASQLRDIVLPVATDTNGSVNLTYRP